MCYIFYYSKMRWNESKKFASGRDLETNLVTSWKGRGRPPGQNPKLECFTKTLDYTFDYISWKIISNGDTKPEQIKATVALFQIWHQVCCVSIEDADMHALKMIEYLLIRELNSYSSSDDKEWKQSAF